MVVRPDYSRLWFFFFFQCYCDHGDLHVLPHSSPTLRSSVLLYAAGDSHPAGLPQLGWKLLDRFLRSGWAPTGWGRTGWLNPSPPAYPRGFAWYQESQLHDTPRFGYLRSEEHTSELQSLMRISYAVFCLKKKKNSQFILTNKPQKHQ